MVYLRTKKIGDTWVCAACYNNKFLSGVGKSLSEAYAELERKICDKND